jgi:hypothetical protein
MQIEFLLWLFAVSCGASALGGMLGMASGIFIVPILAEFGHVDIRTAIASSIVSVIACSCGSAAPFLRGGFTNIRLAVVLETATTLGAVCGVILAGVAPVAFLYLLFALILVVSAQQMLARRSDPAPGSAPSDVSGESDKLKLHSSYPGQGMGHPVHYRVRRLPLGWVLMFAAGLVSALLGIGSGVLKIPAMDTALRLPIKVSSATSNFMIGVTAAASAGAYFMRGAILPSIAGPVALGSVLGAMIGGRILMRISSEKLRLFFVLILIALAVQMFASAYHHTFSKLHP